MSASGGRTSPIRRSRPPAPRPAGPRRRSRSRARRKHDQAATRPSRDWIAITATALPGIAALGALIFAALSVTATDNQLKIAEQGQITDRYNAAIANLGSRSIDIRLGGIYALQRLMQDSPRDQPTVVAVLSAFVRDETSSTAAKQGPQTSRVPTDVQAALTVVGTRNTVDDGPTKVVDLSFAQLANAVLIKDHFRGAAFPGADLSHAALTGANLGGANLRGADLTGADLSYVNLTLADLSHAALTGAELFDVDLRDAFILHADLRGADLYGVNLIGAHLIGTDLRGADLTLAHLTGVDCTGVNLTGAIWPTRTRVPDGWVRDPSSGRLSHAKAGA